MGIVSADFGGRRTRGRLLRWGLGLLAFFVIVWWGPGLLELYTDWLWFKHDVEYSSVFWKILTTKLGLGLVFGAAFLVLVLANVELARRLARRTIWYDEERLLRQRIAEVMEYLASRYLYIGLVVLTVFVAYLVGVGAAGQWNRYLLFNNAVPFELNDPIFDRDVSFYVFRLPFWRYLWEYAYWVLIAVFLISAATHYLDKAIRVLRGIPAFAPHVKSHLSILLGLILVVKALGYRLDAYYLLYSPRGATFGASYTDVHAQLLAYNVLFVIALACAALVLINMHFRGLWLPLAGIGFLALSSLVLNVAYPAIVQRLHVEPNELAREEEYIAHSIRFTRLGFNLHNMELKPVPDVTTLSSEQVRQNVASVENVRLWDYRPLLETYEKQQELWPYYKFNSVDIDRYWIDGEYRQVMLAARELYVPGLPEKGKGWLNEHIFYTHGYGVVMSPVSDVIGSGLPHLILKDIPPQSSFDLEVTRPGIYYGELTNEYVIVGTTEDENDYPLPTANEMAKCRYEGEGGVPIGSGLARLATAVRFKDLNIIISTAITDETRVLWTRNVAQRAREIAPFLSFDRDPYIVLGEDGHLYWIQDAYTTSGMFPYSEPFEQPNARFSYVRNSVKIVTDAYDGTVSFFVADPGDPIVQVYERIFPVLFEPMEDMPAGLIDHIRYPEALFNTQAERLTVYHMTDPRNFYNRNEKWEIAKESPKTVGRGARSLVGRTVTSEGETMQAYYAIVQLPDETAPEYLIMLPFTPQDKPNMVAWLAGRCDGEHYSKMVTYNFPKTEQIWGPIQIEASINQDETISAWITLRNQQGSSVIQGNLLVIPMDGSVLYVEPIYLKAAQSPIPELKQVILARGSGEVVMRPTLSQALEALVNAPAPRLAALEPQRAGSRPAEEVAAAMKEAGLPVTEPSEEVAAEAPPAEFGPEAEALARRAQEKFEEVLARQREGDWAAYGKALDELRQLLSELVERET